jgi:hypothetical protein
VKTVAEVIDYLCETLLIEAQDGTLPDELWWELARTLKRGNKRGDAYPKLTKAQLNMPWDKFLEEIETRGSLQ